jgi:hypothetical protein
MMNGSAAAGIAGARRYAAQRRAQVQFVECAVPINVHLLNVHV